MSICVCIGTKGQYVKTAPVLLEMDARGMAYRLVHANQHPLITKEIAESFGLRETDCCMAGGERDIATTGEALRWLGKNLLGLLTGSSRRLFLDGTGATPARGKGVSEIMLIHGDAPPALLSLAAALRFRMKIAHLESGERTYNPFQPFPEELIRILVDRFSRILFAGSSHAVEYLRKERVRGEVVFIGMNTLLDAVRLALRRGGEAPFKEGEYALFSIHRFESINNPRRMRFLLDLLRDLGGQRVVMTLHDSTRHALKRFGLLGELEAMGHVETVPLMAYHRFIATMAGARFVVTDGGGPQQESFLLGVPCLILREKVEQDSFTNVWVAGYDREKVRQFLKEPERFRLQGGIGRFENIQPSRAVVNRLERELGQRRGA
jgi:UDP-N-acetylglucosamine 2-epimerase (non-hydrolysing)